MPTAKNKKLKKIKGKKFQRSESLSTRDSLIQAAIEMLTKEGMSQLSLREIAKHTGLSSMAPYRHFKSKEDLMAAISEVGHKRLGDIFLQVERTQLDPAERFRAMGKEYLHFAKNNPELYKLMFGAGMPNPAQYESLEKACDECYGYLERSILYCQHHGYMKGKPVDAFSMLVWSSVHGLSMLLIEGVLEHSVDDYSEKTYQELNDYFSDVFLT